MSQVTADQILVKAKGVLHEYGWAQGSLAFDWEGTPVSLQSDKADCFCAEGALKRSAFVLDHFKFAGKEQGYQETTETYRFAEHNLIQGIEDTMGGTQWNIGDWNDDPKRTFEEVIAAFDQGLKLIKEETWLEHP